MIITNKNNLPDTLVNAIRAHEHKGGDYSASMITSPIQQVVLRKKYGKELVEDASDRIWSLLGTAVHYVVEKGEAKNEISEQFLKTSFSINGEKITFSGTADLYSEENGGTVTDWKTDSVYTVMNDSRDEERVVQLNAYGYLFRLEGFGVNNLQVVSILRDWSKNKAKNDPNYPQYPVIAKKYPVWDQEKTENYIKTKISLFENYLKREDTELPKCTMEDKWQDPPKWAVMVKGKKRALKLHLSEDEAYQHAENTKGAYVEYRPSEPRRCMNYCSVAKFCKQYEREKI